MVDENNKLHIQKISILRSDQQYVYSHDSIDSQHRLVVTRLETPVSGMTLRIDGETALSTNKNDVALEQN